ncbi:MAG: paraquat-inducible protein A [Cyclobacteriaceae bacterium]|jgi:hypothetical protein|nr:paraquat-inducible protein A [Cyclobacteriaceae bacterium]
MRKEISNFLYKAIDDFEGGFNERQSQSIFGIIKGGAVSLFGAFEELKKEVPTFTEQILNFMNDPKNRKAVRGFIISKLNQYADETFSKIDYSKHDAIISKYGFENRDLAIVGLKLKINQIDSESRPYQIGLIVLGVLTGLFMVFFRTVSKVEYVLLIAICFVFLLEGLLLPMIEIDARISEMSFSLLGESVKFQDQVLYYKSKSILEVVRLMMTQSRLDLLFVGLLVLTFSVLFPVTKLISSILFLNSKRFESNQFIQFIIFKTGKWSMADVMVIAIFMAYIGFSGIITEQLKQIENITQNIDILTTNKSSLLIGFFAFTSFAILSLLTSHKLQYDLKDVKQVDK